MNDIFITADTHFNHKALVTFYRKQFASVDEMNEVMVDRWNSKVRRSDKVYHLGDVALGRPDDARRILDRLNGQIFLVRGNHDKVAENKLVCDRFVWIKDYHRIKVGEQKIYLFHYAMRTWNCMHHGSWMLHGHSHGTLPELNHRSFDVGVDCWDFYPASYEEIAKKMSTKTFVPVDHHGA